MAVKFKNTDKHEEVPLKWFYNKCKLFIAFIETQWFIVHCIIYTVKYITLQLFLKVLYI